MVISNFERMDFSNNLMDCDSYKLSHWLQYPDNTTYMFDYLESRGGKYPATVMAGLQYIIKQYLTLPITKEHVEKMKEFAADHGEPFNYEGWMYIVEKHNGKLPVRIKAVPEGTLVPTHNILLTVESTDPEVFWVASFLETMILRVWYPITVATQSFFIKQTLLEYLFQTSDDPWGEILFKLHDFGSRGVSSRESAGIGGAAHLFNFRGSDTVQGVDLANTIYCCKMSGFSIPAAEHSTITIYGREGELKAYRNMLRQFAKPGSMVAIVSDSYDLWNAVTNHWGKELKEEIIESGATVIIRPDSGHPPDVVLKTLQLLDEQFGHAVNTKGYKVLNNVRVIQGDGINHESIKEICDTFIADGYSLTNVAFGMGGALLQQVNRDTQKFAIKCSAAVVDNEMVSVFKDPVTDPGKASKKGILELRKDEYGEYYTVEKDREPNGQDELVLVYENGELLVEYTMDEIRTRLDSYLKVPELVS
jgi:nicotinamide phosphoribosyltransferase